jgi:serine/threonine-protein kinase
MARSAQRLPRTSSPESAAPQAKSSRRRTAALVAAGITATIVIAAIGFTLRSHSTTGQETTKPDVSGPVPSSAPLPSPTAKPAPSPSPLPAAEPTTAATTPPVSKAGFYGEWGNHFMSVTLAPDGGVHYAVWLGVANGTSWSATWSAITSTTAMVVMTTKLKPTAIPRTNC